MKLSPYHQKQAQLSDAQIAQRAQEKENELKAIFKQTPLKTTKNLMRIAVLGCGDKGSNATHGYYVVSLERLLENLQTNNITYKKIPLPYGVALVLQK